jgi:hypothetical protein
VTHPSDSRASHPASGGVPGPQRRSDLRRFFAAARALHDSAVRDVLASSGHCGPAGAADGLACAVITGDPAAFSTAHDPFIDMVDLPGPDTGWRSRIDIRNGLGQRVSLEFVSRAATRGAEAAGGTGSHRAQALRAIGEADRRLAETATAIRAVRTIARGPVDPTGTTDLLLLSEILDEVEDARVRQVSRRVRRLHGLPAPDPGGPCELVVQVWPAELDRFRTTSLRSLLRHGATGEVLAVGETLCGIRSHRS